MTDTTFGMALLIVAGLMNASFTLPMKFTHRWSWENTWLVWTVSALLILPPIATVCTVPQIESVYASAPNGIVLSVCLFGAGWGVAQVLFGLAVESIGIALTFSLVMGISAAMGSLAPLVWLHPGKVNTPAGHEVLGGVALVIDGVVLCAIAGRKREKILSSSIENKKNAAVGLTLAILCGFGAAFVNFGLAFGEPLVASARQYGAGVLSASNAVWMPLLLAGAIPNLFYCYWLLRKNRTVGKFNGCPFSHWGLALAMAVLWFGSTLLYGAATAKLGELGPILGWPVFMSLIVIVATILGMMTGEWKNGGRAPLMIQWGGVASLVLAVFVLAGASRSLA